MPPTPADAGPSRLARAPQRSREGCLTCRRRKVKCDEVRPLCGKCKIKRRACLWTSHDNEALSHVGSDRYGAQSLERSVTPRLGNTRSRTVCSDAPQRQEDLPSSSDRWLRVKAPRPTIDMEDILVTDQVLVQNLIDPSFNRPYFPTIQERIVFRHYLMRTVHIIIAFESGDHPWNPWIRVLAPLAFGDLPGINPAADALRTAMLAVGSVHLRYCTGESDSEGARSIVQVANERVLGLLQEYLGDDGTRTRRLSDGDIDLVLGALLSSTVASSLAADGSWSDLLSSVLALIERAGGADRLLENAPHDRFSPRRFFLEQLAVREVFGCMSTWQRPVLLRDAFTPWFFESDAWSRSSIEWESVERMFGVTRGMVDVIARVCRVFSWAATVEQSVRLREPKDPTLQIGASSPAVIHGGTDPPSPVDDTDDDAVAGSDERKTLEVVANDLMAELAVWDGAANFTPLHPRTQYGNHCYRHAVRIRLLRYVFRKSRDDPRVVGSVNAVIELSRELLALYGRITWLTWPILIAGFNLPPGDGRRQSVIDLLGAFGPFACFDNSAAVRLLQEYWARGDGMEEEDRPPNPLTRAGLPIRPFLD